MGIASRTPNTHTKTGRATTPPPNPATPAMVKPMVVAITTAILLKTSSNYHLPKMGPGPSFKHRGPFLSRTCGNPDLDPGRWILARPNCNLAHGRLGRRPECWRQQVQPWSVLTRTQTSAEPKTYAWRTYYDLNAERNLQRILMTAVDRVKKRRRVPLPVIGL